MQWLRVALAFMLILAPVPAVCLMPPSASGQGYVTVTSQITTTGFYTYPVATIYENRTVSRYVSPPGNFTLNVCGKGAYNNNKFNGIEGQSFHIEWKASGGIPLDLYITTVFPGVDNSGCWDFLQPSGAALKYVLYHRVSSSGSVDWAAPSTGVFVAWIFNFSVNTVKGSWSIVTTVMATVSSTSYATASTTKLANLTVTTTVAQLVFPFGNVVLLGVIVAVALIAFALVVARRRKSSIAVVKQEEQLAPVQKPAGATVVSQPVTQTQAVQPQPIVSTGYADLDGALEGGIPEKFSVVIVSPSFDERDLLLRRVVQSALSSGRLAILVSNDMGRTEDMTSRYPKGFYALSPQADKISHQGPNLLKIPNIENLSEASISLGITLKDVVTKEKAIKPIMILDLLSDLLLRYRSITTRRWLTDFVGKRKAEGFTIIATLNPLTTTKEEAQSIIDFFDGVIEIFEKPIAERTRRFLMIRKMYGQRYSESEMLMDKDKLF
jgi:KaiC/GvpD/RAD55 family RecA-like ATPase